MMMLGGMMGPMVEAPRTMAAAKSLSYPSFSMAGISMLPSPTASAVADPDIPAKMMEATTQTWPRPPVM